jgi:hypothetical protein
MTGLQANISDIFPADTTRQKLTGFWRDKMIILAIKNDYSVWQNTVPKLIEESGCF